MLSNREIYFLNCARQLAAMSLEKNRHGCVIVRNGNIVGMGINKFRNNPENVTPEHIKLNCSLHAETVAIRQAGNNCRGAVLYVARVNTQGIDRNSKPCINCSEVIRAAGIKRVIHT